MDGWMDGWVVVMVDGVVVVCLEGVVLRGGGVVGRVVMGVV